MFFGLAAIVLFSACGTAQKSAKYDDFAECVTDSGAVFYGTLWCPHCKKQKTLFGDAISKINFVDCDAEKDLCRQKGITSYPTWIFGDGSRRSGTQSLENIAKKTNCPLPKK